MGSGLGTDGIVGRTDEAGATFGGRLGFGSRILSVFRGAKAEDFIQPADNGEGFLFRELAVRVFEWLHGGVSAGADIAIFLDEHGFAASAGEGVDEADEGEGIAAEPEVELASGIFEF